MVSIGAVGGIREGDYKTWTKKWLNPLPNGLTEPYSVDWRFDEPNGLLYLIWEDSSGDNRWGIFNILDFSTVFLSAPGSDYFGIIKPYNWMGAFRRGRANFYYGGVGVSNQSYFLLQRHDGYTLEVWRNHSLLWTRDARIDSGNTWDFGESGGLSLTGKYVLIWGWLDAGPSNLLLYEGG